MPDKVWVGSAQDSANEWKVVNVFTQERTAKLWMYEASNRMVEEIGVEQCLTTQLSTFSWTSLT